MRSNAVLRNSLFTEPMRRVTAFDRGFKEENIRDGGMLIFPPYMVDGMTKFSRAGDRDLIVLFKCGTQN